MDNKEQLCRIEKLINESIKEKEIYFKKQNEILKKLIEKKDLVCLDYLKKQYSIEQLLKNFKNDFDILKEDNEKLKEKIVSMETKMKVYSYKDYIFVISLVISVVMITYVVIR